MDGVPKSPISIVSIPQHQSRFYLLCCFKASSAELSNYLLEPVDKSKNAYLNILNAVKPVYNRK